MVEKRIDELENMSKLPQTRKQREKRNGKQSKTEQNIQK